jgi:uncharacterized protein YqiB (DUF1249 family)
MSFLERSTDDLVKALASSSSQIHHFRTRIYYITLFLELTEKNKKLNRFILEYLDGTGIKLKEA